MAAGDLTTVAAVMARLQAEESSDTFDETLIADFIAAASDQFADFTGRELARPGFDPASRDPYVDEPEAREFVSRGYLLDLHPYDVRRVTSVTDVTDGSAAITSFKVRPKPPKYGAYTWLELPGLTGEREVEVTGYWGFPEIPEFVSHWCAITVVTWLRSDVAAHSTSFGIDEGRLHRPEELPAATRGALRRLKRKAV